jgi:hypothetical protein
MHTSCLAAPFVAGSRQWFTAGALRKASVSLGTQFGGQISSSPQRRKQSSPGTGVYRSCFEECRTKGPTPSGGTDANFNHSWGSSPASGHCLGVVR